MNPTRTPPKLTGSHPDLSRLVEDPQNNSSSVTFRKRKQREDEFTDALNNFRSEIMSELKSTLKDFFHNQNDALMKLTTDVRNFSVELKGIKETQEKIALENTKLQTDFKNLKKDSENKIISLEKSLADSNSTIQDLNAKIQLSEQQGRCNNLEISGVPLIKGENLVSIITTLSVKIGVCLERPDIDYIKRVRRFSTQNDGYKSSESGLFPNIIVRFTQRKKKQDFLAAVRARRGITSADLDINGAAKPVFVNDHLTPQNKLLYRQVRITAKENNFKFVWLNDSKIFVRKSETSKPILINSNEDLSKIK